MANTNKVIFKDAANATFLKKYASLFPGLGFAAGYKIAQRIYKFGGQPFVNEFLNRHYKKEFHSVFGEKTGKTIMHATAGSFVGIGEIALLPLDVLKIKRQTNPEAFRGRGVFKIVADEGMGLYRCVPFVRLVAGWDFVSFCVGVMLTVPFFRRFFAVFAGNLTTGRCLFWCFRL